MRRALSQWSGSTQHQLRRGADGKGAISSKPKVVGGWLYLVSGDLVASADHWT
jgi:hypothetical protein